MKRLLVILSLAACMAHIGCGGSAAPVAASTPAPEQAPPAPVEQPPAAKKTHVSGAVPANADGEKFSAALVVLRVELIKASGGSKYHWDRVKPLQVLKNDSESTFDQPLDVAHYGWNSGVPAGTSTIYLERYGADHQRWRLLGSDGALGVSHAQAK